MANLTLNRSDSSLVMGGRSKIANADGDLFMGIWDHTNATAYNGIRTQYLALEDSIHAAVIGGFTVTGTNGDGTPFSIGDDVLHPRPPQK